MSLLPQNIQLHQQLIALDAEQQEYCIKLFPPWKLTEVDSGDIVNVIGRPEPNEKVYVVDNERNFLIVHPDILIPGTVLSKYSECGRMSYLQMKTVV